MHLCLHVCIREVVSVGCIILPTDSKYIDFPVVMVNWQCFKRAQLEYVTMATILNLSFSWVPKGLHT